MHESISLNSTDEERSAQYLRVFESIEALLEGDDVDWVAAMATVSCELHHAFDYYHWTGFYRHTSQNRLTVGPYQGSHGCLYIAFERGVCGAAARTKQTQLVPNVHEFPGHIACSSSTNSEIVVPLVTPQGEVLAVFDVDSNDMEAFREVDQQHLEVLCEGLARRFADALSL